VGARSVANAEQGDSAVDGENSEQQVRRILAEHAGLSVDVSTIEATADLYALGMSSRASVSVMLAIESDFDLEFPDDMLRREVFATVSAMCDAIKLITKS
jgi:acyl carrier protein